MADPLPHNIKIAADIRAKIKAGVSMRVIHDYLVGKYPDAPRSYQTLYKVYRDDIADARADMHTLIGNTIMKKAIVDQDMKALELVARSKMGWSPTMKVVEENADDINEDTSAIDDLVALLGINKGEDAK